MTVKISALIQSAFQKMSNDAQSHRDAVATSDHYRSLDRALATRYMQIVLSKRRRAQAIRSGLAQAEPMRPRYAFSHAQAHPATYHRRLASSIEICDRPDAQLVTAVFELPGLRRDEISIRLTNEGRLIISGERTPPTLLLNTDLSLPRYPVRELKYGRFERAIDIPPSVEVRRSADYQCGEMAYVGCALCDDR